MPSIVIWNTADWPVFELPGGGQVKYTPCPYPDKLPPQVTSYENVGLRDDILAIMEVAARSGLDPQRFSENVRSLLQFRAVAHE